MRSRFCAVLITALALGLGAAPAAQATGGYFIVVLRAGASANAVAADYGTKPAYIYTSAFNGFAANIELTKASKLAGDPRVEFVTDDREHFAKEPKPDNNTPFRITDIAQFVPRGVSRIGTLQSPTAKIDGIDDA